MTRRRFSSSLYLRPFKRVATTCWRYLYCYCYLILEHSFLENKCLHLGRLIHNGTKEQSYIRTYKRRWYVLVMFGIYAFSQGLVWNTWGPISASSEYAFGWSDATIAWLTNWGPVSYILTGLFYPWLLQVKGLRWATLSSMFMVVLGSSFRIITSDPFTATILIHIGQFLNGVAGPIAMCAFPTLSATWFPPHERVTATAIGASIGYAGTAIAFILGPAFVSSLPAIDATEITNARRAATSLLLKYDDRLQTTAQQNITVTEEREEIMKYMYYQCGWSVLVFVVILCYFPAKPPSPPCVSATVERDGYWSGLWSLRKKGYFMIIAVSYSISLGVLSCWATLIYINLKNHDVSQSTAGWIGFYATMGGCIVSLIIGRFSDLFTHFMKLFILVLYILGTVFLIAFALLLIDVIPYTLAHVYVTVIAANVLISAAVPVMFELACELAYPTSEGAANGFLTYLNNFWGLVFLAIFSFPNIGTMWMNWTVIGSTAICIPLIAMLKGRFNRLEVDKGVHTSIKYEVLVDYAQ